MGGQDAIAQATVPLLRQQPGREEHASRGAGTHRVQVLGEDEAPAAHRVQDARKAVRMLVSSQALSASGRRVWGEGHF